MTWTDGYRKSAGSVFAVLFTLLSGSQSAGADVVKTLANLPEVTRDGFVKIVADRPLSASQGKRVLDLIERAYEFDIDQLGWKKTGNLAMPMTVAVVSDKWMKAHRLRFMGGSFNSTVFAVRDEMFSNPVYDGVIAHELTHLLVMRQFLGDEARNHGWSAVMGEGMASHNGKRFRLATNQKRYPQHRIPANDIDQTMTGLDAKQVFSETGDVAESNRFRYPVGLQFIEFVRLRLDGKGHSDAIRQFGAMVADMARTHKPFDKEFQEHFGTLLDGAHLQFVQFITSTENNPAARFADTILMPKKPGTEDE